MIINFFKNISEPVVGVDYSAHPDCVYSADVEFNPDIQIVELVQKNEQYAIKIFEKPIKKNETLEEKRKRLFEKFITEKDVNNFDWEDYQLSENDYNQLIVLRNFNGDHGSQIATLTKMHFKHIGIYLQLGISKEQIKQIFAEEIAMVQKISESRVALGLSPFDLSFLE